MSGRPRGDMSAVDVLVLFACLIAAFGIVTCGVRVGANEPCQPVQCEKVIRVELSQTHYTLDIWEHIKDSANKTELSLPVSCQFYDSVRVGDNLLRDNFRWGSLAVRGSFGSWNLKVVGK